MRLLEDERGVTVQIGAILMFAILVILLSTYQAYVVPQENEAIEFQHSQEVESDLVAVRNAVLSAAASGGGRPESVALGTQYPVRTFFVNPPSATGTLQTEAVGNATLSIANVTAVGDPETEDFFERQNGTLTYPTKSLVYDAQYNVYDGAPSRVLENGLLYNDFGDVHTVPSASTQVVVDGTTITLVALNGSYFQNGVTASAVDPSVLSGPSNPVDVTNTTGNVTITFSSRMPASEWRNRTSLGNQQHVVSVTQAGENQVRVVLEDGVEYSLRAAKIGIGSQTADTDAAYITRVGDSTVRVGDPVTFEVRDEYNNPVPNADVTVSGGTVDGSATQSTGSDGRVTYEFSDVSSNTRATIGSDTDDADRVEFDVEEATGGGNGTGSAPYSIEWQPELMDDQPGVEYVNGTIVITPSEASSPIDAISRAITSANNGVSGVFVDYSTENASVATFPSSSSNDDTNATGYSTVSMTYDTGNTTVYVSGLVGSDTLPVSVQRAENGVYYRYYEGDYGGGGMPNFDAQTPQATGNVDTFDISPRERDNDFGFQYTAYIEVPESGTYTFSTSSDDGSRLYIDDQLVVNNDGEHPEQTVSGDISLSAGRHNITVTYFENQGEEVLTTSWDGPSFTEEEIPSSVLTPRVPSDDGGGTSEPTPEIAFRLDDLTHQDQDSVEYIGSYSVSNTNSSFQRVEVDYTNTNENSASQTLQKSGTRGGLTYTSSNGAGDAYDVTVRVIYSDGAGGEYVVASETVSDTADAVNPSGNDNIGTSATATLDSSTITDKSSNGQGPRYRFDYTVSASGSHSQTRLVAVSTTTGGKAETTRTARSGNNVRVSPGYGYDEEFKVTILVFGGDGAVVDSYAVIDDADGSGP
ncbi:PA14 domain-containing protein [Salarchaeum japonicum]|uniref:PA14 domain-containing protein n=1 Tax=Salarchaeum japonicum TaxID=555573 RepID=UPI003C712768